MSRPGIKDIEYYLPDNYVDTVQMAKRFGLDNNFIFNKTGMKKLSKKVQNDACIEFGFLACKKLLKKYESTRKDVGLLVVVTQTPDNNGIPHMSAVLHSRLELNKNCICFDIGLGCSGYVQALQIVQAMMVSNNIKNGIIVTSDQYSKRVDTGDKNTSLLFGDGASATLMCSKGSLLVPHSFNYGIESMKSNSLNHANEFLEMNGRSVFEFAIRNVPTSIKDIVSNAGHSLEDIDAFIVHQGSKFIVDQIRLKLGIDPGRKVPFACSDHGNTISSSIPITLKSLDLLNTNLLVLSGFGVGLSFSTSLLTRCKQTN